jgi:hypothetical protein
MSTAIRTNTLIDEIIVRYPHEILNNIAGIFSLHCITIYKERIAAKGMNIEMKFRKITKKFVNRSFLTASFWIIGCSSE